MLTSLLAVFFFAVVAPMSTVVVTAEIQGNVTWADITNKDECDVLSATWRSTCTTEGNTRRHLRRTAVRSDGGVRGTRRRDLSSNGIKTRVLKGSKKGSKKGKGGLTGKQVEGTLEFKAEEGTLEFAFFEGTNFFDPINCGVPADAGPQPLTVVQDPDVGGSVEFLMSDNISASILVDIDETSITIQEPILKDPFEANDWEIILDFQDLDKDKIENVIIVTDTFDGGVTVSFTDTTITILPPPFGFSLDGDDEVTLDVELGK